MTAATAKKPAVTEVDVGKLTPNPKNLRRAKTVVKSMVDNVARLGVLQPLLVEDLGNGKYMILAGHRRHAAAAVKAKLKTVPVLVFAPDDPVALLMLSENGQREDLTIAEEAEGYLQLQAEGLDVATIAKDTGVDVARVEGAVKAGASKTATTVAHKYDLTLEQTLVLAEFEDDREAIKDLTEIAVKRPGQFEHTASRLRQRREAQKAYDAEIAKLQKAGVKILKKGTSTSYSLSQRNCRIDQLKGDNGKELTPANHKDCPGHAAAIIQYNPHDVPRVEYVCADAKKHGHKDRWGSSSGTGKKAADMTEAERAKASEARRAVIQNNKDWKAALPVRLEFVRKLLQRKAPPKGTLRFVTETIAGQPGLVNDGPARVLEDLVGSKGPQSGYHNRPALGMARKGSDGALPMALAALVCAGVEAAMEYNTWRATNTAIKPYFAWLKACGYELAPVEEILVKGGGK